MSEWRGTKVEKRIVKFRAWDTEKGRMFGKVFDSSAGGEDWYFPKLRDKFVIMQYTGIDDAAGREIYEEDMIECASRGIFIVKFIQGAFYGVSSLTEILLLSSFNDPDIIGNNYEEDFEWKMDMEYVEFRLKEKQKNKVENWF